MREVTATEAARRFSDLLDAVEHGHETFVVTRGGKTVALIAPAPEASGRVFREVLRRHGSDSEWATELARLILDTTVLVGAERGDQSLDHLVADDDDVAIAAVTAAELLVGVALADDRRRSSREAFCGGVADGGAHRGLRLGRGSSSRRAARPSPTSRPFPRRP